jgi:hypothetical protein
VAKPTSSKKRSLIKLYSLLFFFIKIISCTLFVLDLFDVSITCLTLFCKKVLNAAYVFSKFLYIGYGKRYGNGIHIMVCTDISESQFLVFRSFTNFFISSPLYSFEAFPWPSVKMVGCTLYSSIPISSTESTRILRNFYSFISSIMH